MSNTNKLSDKISDTGKAFCEILADAFDVDVSPDDRDRFFLQVAKYIRMSPGGRAEEYLDHFLSGDGTPKHFETSLLLAEDTGVSYRLRSEVVRRALGIRTLREKYQDSIMSLSGVALDDRKSITIFQHNYASSDWHLALGTFSFNWEPILCTEDRRFMTVRVYGSNTYKWHPKSPRITKFLHEAGFRLSENGLARNFEIIAKPIFMKVDIVQRETLELFAMTQANPRMRGLLSDERSETANEVSRVLEGVKNSADEVIEKVNSAYERLSR